MQTRLINAPSTHQKMMDKILMDVQFAGTYLDDVIVHSATKEEHVEHLAGTLGMLSRHDLRLRLRV